MKHIILIEALTNVCQLFQSTIIIPFSNLFLRLAPAVLLDFRGRGLNLLVRWINILYLELISDRTRSQLLNQADAIQKLRHAIWAALEPNYKTYLQITQVLKLIIFNLADPIKTY